VLRLLGLLNHAWKGVLKAPLAILGAGLLISSFSLVSGVLGVLLVVAELALKTVMGGIADLVHGYSARHAFIRNRAHYTLRRISERNPIILDGLRLTHGLHRLRVVQKFVGRMNTQGSGPALSPINVYRVYLAPGLTEVPSALASYSGINAPSYVFLYEEPGASPVARFLLYHELAHVGLLATEWSSARYYESALAVFLTLKLLHGSDVALLCCCAWLGVRLLSRISGASRLAEEIAADTLALRAVALALNRAAAERVCGFLERLGRLAIENMGYRAGLPYARASHAKKVVQALARGDPPFPDVADAGWLTRLLATATLILAFTGTPHVYATWSAILVLTIVVVACGLLYYQLLGFVMGMADLMRREIHPKPLFEPEQNPGKAGVQPSPSSELAEDECREFLLLMERSRYAWRSVSGLADQSGLDPGTILRYLSTLRRLGYIWEHTPCSDGPRWAVDSKGEKFLYPEDVDWTGGDVREIFKRGLREMRADFERLKKAPGP